MFSPTYGKHNRTRTFSFTRPSIPIQHQTTTHHPHPRSNFPPPHPFPKSPTSSTQTPQTPNSPKTLPQPRPKTENQKQIRQDMPHLPSLPSLPILKKKKKHIFVSGGGISKSLISYQQSRLFKKKKQDTFRPFQTECP